MGDVATEFFDDLAECGPQPMLRRATGTIRFDLESGKATERWTVAFERGDLAVSRRQGAADCVVRVDRPVFDRMVTGKQGMFAALVRGQMVATATNIEPLVLFQRLVRARQQARHLEAAQVPTRGGRRK